MKTALFWAVTQRVVLNVRNSPEGAVHIYFAEEA